MRTRLRPFLAVFLAVLLTALVSPGCSKEDPTPKHSMTIDNLQGAYGVAVKRASWYALFAEASKKDGGAGTRSLFLAIARSEEIRGKRHAELLRSLGFEPVKADSETIVVGTPAQSLKMAISCEWLQIRSLYPNLIRSAQADGMPEAVELFTQALNVDVRHLELFKDASEHHGKIPKATYRVCSECGFIVTAETFEECPTCHAKKERFETI